jgi:hypothetical protein
MAIALRNDEYTKLWSGAEDVGSDKLKVEFTFSVNSATPLSQASTSAKTASENVHAIRSTMPSRQPSAASPQSAVSQGDHAGSIDAAYNELHILRKKYDDVIAYTVNLTAERDAATNQLEETRKEMAREIARRRAADTPKNFKQEKTSDGKKVVQQVIQNSMSSLGN